MTIFVEELYAHDSRSYCSLVRLSDSNFAAGISLHPGMAFLPMRSDPYYGPSRADAERAYYNYIKE